MEKELTILNQNLNTITQLVLVNLPAGSTKETAERVALKEISNFEMILQMKPELKSCNPLSILLAVKQTISDNLTLSPSAGLVYLVPSKVKIGQNGNQDIFDWVLSYDPTANGRLSIARQSGRILDNKRPVVTYDESGKVSTVTVEFLVPSYPEPRWEVITFNKVHFEKWMSASARKNKGAANANYTSWQGSIDPEFAGTKAIRHGLGKLGSNMNEVKKEVISGAPIKFESPEAAIKEAKEESGFTAYEEIKPEPKPQNEIPNLI